MKRTTLLAIVAVLLLNTWGRAQSLELPAQSADAQESRPAICGINALYTALQVVGLQPNFRSLLSPKYVSSTAGSTYADLLAGARDQHASAEVYENLSVDDLRALRQPVILHVRPEFDSLSFSHFVLVVPNARHELLVFDAPTPPRLLTFPELAAIWDRSAMVVASSPESLPTLSRNLRRPIKLALVALVVFAMLMLFRSRIRRWTDQSGKAQMPVQFAALILFTCIATGSFHTFSTIGYFREMSITRIIAKSRIVSSTQKIDRSRFANRLLSAATVIDARFNSDFQQDHIGGALNIPPDTSQAARARILKDVDHSAQVVVYCASPSCPYASILANRLSRDGFENVEVYPGGIEDWSHATATPLTNIAEIK